MATNKSTKTGTTKTVAADPETTESVAVAEETETKAPAPKTKAAAPTKIKFKDIDETQYVTVRNGFHGWLVYKSTRTGEKYQWQDFGDTQEIELRELKNVKSANKKFFTNNWFMFDEDWIIDYLGVRQYYAHAVSVDEFDSLFDMKAEDLAKVLSEMTDGQKRSLSYRARQLYEEGKIDSLSVIRVIQDGLGINIIDK